jgi:predicted MFS family arabinose efflux permease
MDAQQKRYEWGLVSIMFFTWGTLFLDRMTLLYIAPYIIPDLHLDGEQVGQLAAITAITWAISTLVFGALSDRIGRRKVMIPMIFIFSIMSFLSGLAQTFGELMLARALMGVAEGPCWSIMNAIVERSSSPQTRTRNVGIVVSAAALVGMGLAPVLSTQVAAVYGWRAAFFVAGAPGLVMGVLMIIFVKEPPRVSDSGVHDHEFRFADLGLLLKNRNVLLSCVGACGFVGWLLLLNIFAPLYMTQVMHCSPTEAGFLMGAAGLGSFVLGTSGAWIAHRMGRRTILLLFAALSCLLPLALLTPALYQVPMLLAGILFLTQGGQAITALIMVLIPAASVPVRLIASAVGLATMCGEIVGATLMPVWAGKMAVTHGLGVALQMAAASMAVVFLAALFVREPGAQAHRVRVPNPAE